MTIASTQINAKVTGGATGNGSTDDKAALQKALNAAATAGVPLYLPNGTYMISDTLVTTVPIFAEPGAMIKAMGASFNKHMLAVNAANVKIENLKVNGNLIAVEGIRLVGNNARFTTIRDCEVYNMRQLSGYTRECVGIRIQGGLNRILIEGCYIHDLSGPITGICRGVLANTDGVSAASKNIEIVNNRFEEIGPTNDGDGVVVQNYIGWVGLTVAGNYFNRCYKRAIKVQVIGYTVTGNIIENNIMGTTPEPWGGISAYNGYGVVSNNTINLLHALNPIEVGDDDVAEGTPHVKVIGNTIKNDKAAGNVGNLDGIRVYGKCDGLQIIGNSIKDGRYGIHLNTLGIGIQVHGNIIENTDQTAIKIDASIGQFKFPTPTWPQFLSIVGNMIKDCKSYGIFAGNATALAGRNVTVIGNMGNPVNALVDSSVSNNATMSANLGTGTP